MAQIPTHKDWKKFKEKHGVGSNMVGAVNVGKALDTYHSKLSTANMKQNADLASALAAVLTTYKAKFPDKKGTYKAFLDGFDKDYLKAAVENVGEFKAMAGDRAQFAVEVQGLLQATQKVAANVGLAALQTYRQGPVRGMLAAATRVKGYDAAPLVKIWKPIDDIINGLGTGDDQAKLDKVAKLCVATAQKTVDIGRSSGLFTK